MKIKLLLLSAVVTLSSMSSCSDKDAVNDVKSAASLINGLSTSNALSYVSVYADENCTEPLIENAPLTGNTTSLEFPLTYGLNTVYVKYPTSGGVKIISQAVNVVAEYNSNFKYETDRYVTLYVDFPEDAVKNYVTNDGGFTNYHSSGVVMFEDTWPSKSNVDGNKGEDIFGDFNDLVVDYDLEATVNDVANSNQTWKEGLKVVMHVRAMGGKYTKRLGLLLEGLDKQYVDENNTEIKVTLGNYDETAADPLTASIEWEGEHPIIYIDNLQKLVNVTAAKANGLTLGTEQKLYNVENDANLNVARGLFTVTAIFKGIDRSMLSEADGKAQVNNYINAVINTRLQNFFLVTTQGGKSYEVHLQNYNPTSAYKTYEADLNDKAEGVSVPKDGTQTYTAADGRVWGIKTPVITRHAVERVSFTEAYPLYEDWLNNRSATSALWYLLENANQAKSNNTVTFCTGLTKQPYVYIIEEW